MGCLLSSPVFIFLTLFTDPAKFQPALLHTAIVPQPVNFRRRIFQRNHHIQNASAVFTDEMAVRLQIRVKTIRPVCREFADLSQFYQQRKIPVHRTKADIGVFPADIHIDPVCRRMIFSSAQIILNAFPLSAVL